MQTHSDDQNQISTAQWLKNTHESFDLFHVLLIDRIDKYMFDYNSNQVVEVLATLLESYLTVSAYSGIDSNIKEMASVVSVSTHHMAFLSGLRYDWQNFTDVPFVEAKPIKAVIKSSDTSGSDTLQFSVDVLKGELRELEKQNSVTQAQDLKNLIRELTSLRTQAGEHIELEHLQKASELVRNYRQAYAVKESDPQKEESYLTPLELAIDEVWAGYRDVKRRFNIEDEYIKGRLCVWTGLIEEFAGLTGFINPDDHGWEKMLDNFREQYQALISK